MLVGAEGSVCAVACFSLSLALSMSLPLSIEGSVRRSALVPLAPTEPCCHRVSRGQCCSVLQCVAVHCSTLQCVAVYCHSAPTALRASVAVWWSTLQSVAVSCDGAPPRLPSKYPALSYSPTCVALPLACVLSSTNVYASAFQCCAVWWSILQSVC